MKNNCNFLIKEYHKCLQKQYNYKCYEILEFLIRIKCLDLQKNNIKIY